jgi:hypothetical protein
MFRALLFDFELSVASFVLINHSFEVCFFSGIQVFPSNLAILCFFFFFSAVELVLYIRNDALEPCSPLQEPSSSVKVFTFFLESIIIRLAF